MHTIRMPNERGLAGPLVLAGWLKQEGQPVAPSEPIAEIEALQAQIELQAGVGGTLLKVLVRPGRVIEIGESLCIVGSPGQDVKPVLDHLSRTSSAGGNAMQTPDRDATSPPGALEPAGPDAPSPPKTPAGRVIPILMPQAGQTMEEGTLIAWKVRQGDRIAAGQVIFDIETDKATMEVEATDSGRLARIAVGEGRVVPVKTPVAFLAEDDADVDAYLASQGSWIGDQGTGGRDQACPERSRGRSGGGGQGQAQREAQRVGPSPAQVSEGGRVKASPAARKLAAQRGVDLAALGGGSGPGGRILSTDLAAAGPATASGPRGGGLSKMRQAIARNLLWSKQNIPHFYAKRVVEAQALFTTYRKTKEQFRCTINDFVTAACARAIREFPGFRSQFADGTIVELPSVNIGIAVGTDEGLTVPVVLNADRMDLQTLAQKSRQVVENARAGRLEGVGQGVFTITNMGMLGIEEFLAIINPPESAILAVGAIQETVKVQDGSILPTRIMTLCLSVDHRVIDGIMSAQFLNRVKELLENPEQLIHGD